MASAFDQVQEAISLLNNAKHRLYSNSSEVREAGEAMVRQAVKLLQRVGEA